MRQSNMLKPDRRAHVHTHTLYIVCTKLIRELILVNLENGLINPTLSM